MKAETVALGPGPRTEDPWRNHRVVLHADMDAFYAAIEQRERPALRGRPVIVGGPRNARGVVSAASYEARAFGVHSAMPLRLAARLCPSAAFVPGRMDLYAEVSERVLNIFRTYTPLVEPLSLDEAFLDVTGCERRYGPPRKIAEHLRRAVLRDEGLAVSVGVAATKSVAKIASDVAKPDGCREVRPGTESEFLAPLPVRALWGIGPKTDEHLRALGIRTIHDLTEHEPQGLSHGLGAAVAKSLRRGRGVDPRPVAPQRGRKSVGNEVTFERDLDDRRLVSGYLQQLSDHVGRRLRAKRLRGRTVALKLRYADFRTISRQVTPEFSIDSGDAIFEIVRGLFLHLAKPGDRYRLVGVHVSSLDRAGLVQLPLCPPTTRERHRLDGAMDAVREKFGDAAVTAASLLDSQARLGAERYAWRDAVLA